MARADAGRNADALLAAASEEFAISGVNATVRAIAARAGVTTPTLYRHFPARSDLITAVFRRDIDACGAEAATLSATLAPEIALERWLWRYADLIASKPGLAIALHSGDPAFAALPIAFQEGLAPALRRLLSAAAAVTARPDVDPLDLLSAIAKLSIPPTGTRDRSRADRMITLLIDGLMPSTTGRSTENPLPHRSRPLP